MAMSAAGHEVVEARGVVGPHGHADAGVDGELHVADRGTAPTGIRGPMGGGDGPVDGRRPRRGSTNSSPPRRASTSRTPDRAGQARADEAEHLVAGVVAEGVVDLLETVEVDDHAPPCRRMVDRPAEGLLDPFVEVAAVGQAR